MDLFICIYDTERTKKCTRWHMRTKTVKNIGLTLITLMKAEQDFPDDDTFEPIIIYDERMEKIPYSYTDSIS